MKHLYLFIILVTSLCYAQPEKEILLNNDSKEVVAQLQLMDYLDNCTMRYAKLTPAQRLQAEPAFKQYY